MARFRHHLIAGADEIDDPVGGDTLVDEAIRPDPRVRGKALVIDVDAQALAFAAEALGSFRPGFEVATARDVDQAVAWLESFHPDLVLLDLDLPGRNAQDLTSRLKTDPRTAHCQIIGVSKRTDAKAHLNPGTLGVQAVLAKPLRLNALLGAVRRLTGL